MKPALLMVTLAACGVVPHVEPDSGVKIDAGVVDASEDAARLKQGH